MYSYEKKIIPKNAVELVVTVAYESVEKAKEEAFADIVKDLTVEGFRKGKVPKNIAKNHVKDETVLQKAVQTLLSKIYEEIIKKENIKPIISPKIEFIDSKDKKDWKIKITVCEKPKVDLGNYKEEIKKIKSNLHKEKIWTPGKAEEKKDENEQKSHMINHVLETVLKTAKIEIPDVLIDDEVEKRLSRLLDDIEKIGLTVEKYLKSKNTTIETIKDSYRREIEDTYKLEFILSEIADKESIRVDKADLDKLFINIKDEDEKRKAEQNSYYYASIIRKQKTIDFLAEL